jgi:hypothetical protein
VTDCEIFLYYRNSQVGHIPSTGTISVNGTKINFSSLPKVDEVKVVVKSFTGNITGQSVAGLAEVETIARISFYEIIGLKKISNIASEYKLYQNYPNPFNPVTRIRIQAPLSPPEGGKQIVSLKIYDVLGREVSTLLSSPWGRIGGATYEVEFDGASFASGIYFYKLTVGSEYSEVKKMVLVK